MSLPVWHLPQPPDAPWLMSQECHSCSPGHAGFPCCWYVPWPFSSPSWALIIFFYLFLTPEEFSSRNPTPHFCSFHTVAVYLRINCLQARQFSVCNLGLCAALRCWSWPPAPPVPSLRGCVWADVCNLVCRHTAAPCAFWGQTTYKFRWCFLCIVHPGALQGLGASWGCAAFLLHQSY